MIRAIFMITLLADRSIRPTVDEFYAMTVAFSAGGDGGRKSPEHYAPTSRKSPTMSVFGQTGHWSRRGPRAEFDPQRTFCAIGGECSVLQPHVY